MDIKLSADDPTIFVKCPQCTKTGRGMITGNYFATAYSRKKWGKGNKSCPNCGSKLIVFREIV